MHMNRGLKKYLAIGVLAVSILAACKISQPYTQPPSIAGNQFRDNPKGDTSSLAGLRYAEIFSDTVLQELIRQGITENLDLKTAYTRVRQSQAYYLQSGAAFYPSLNANLGASENKLTEAQGFGSKSITQFQFGVSSAWEADIWGKLKASRRASQAALLQTEAGARAIQTSIVSDIANNYYLLLALDEQLAITEQTVRNWDTTVIVMQTLKQAATVTEAAVVQSQAQRYAAEVTIPDLRQSILETENFLSVLTGRAPDSIRRTRLQIQRAPDLLQTGVPAQLLANRPDVQAAEFAYRNAFELTNVARTAFYPSFTISGSAGLSSITLGSLFETGAIAANIAAGLTQPIFNRRALKTNLTVAEAQQEAALYNFRNSLLFASQEVSNAFSLHQHAMEKATVRTRQLTALTKSVEYTQELLRNGFANYTEVITARQSLLAAELGSVNDQLQRLQATVNLYRSLGGGWR
ncbi:MAG: Efflux transporter, outer rane factor lipoprotein NodT family [Ferruginibacter sp.]|nr:Efflux transporter, outer rane factor lipoprotein NodT family [Ferruginibacter sp.]